MKTDRFHPIVVKEVRQGLKSRAFIVSFICLQTFVVLSLMIQIIYGSNQIYFDGIFMVVPAIVALIAMPARAIGGVHQERTAATLDLLTMTRMTSWDIVKGKWLALVLQLFLLLVSILPFLVVRYFLGSIEIASQLIQFGFLSLCSMMLLALGIASSCGKSRLVRSFIMIGFFFLTIVVLPFLLSLVFGNTAPTRVFTRGYFILNLSGFLLAAALFIAVALAFAADRISPRAVNYVQGKRVAALGLIAVLSGLAAFTRQPFGLNAGIVIAIPLCIDALCEPVRLLPGLYRSRRRGIPRLIRRVFYPGWPSGFIFSLIMAGMLTAASISLPRFDIDVIWAGFSRIMAALMVPLAIVLLVKPSAKNLLKPYLIVLICLIIIHFFALNFFYSATVIVILLVSLAIVILKSFKPWQRILALEPET